MKTVIARSASDPSTQLRTGVAISWRTKPYGRSEIASRCSLAVTLLLLLWPYLALGQTPYPNKPIRFISPYAPGGSTSTVARVVAQKLTERWGQQVIVDNRSGGNTIIGTETLARATPDGYTMIMTTNTHVILPSLYPKLPYDPIKDFAPIGNVYRSEFVLVVTASLPANNLQELIALAKAKPGQLNYATTGAPRPASRGST